MEEIGTIELYLTFLREKESTTTANYTSEVEIGENWIRFDSLNAQAFERTVPVYCCINGTNIQGKNWARILVALVENELANMNPALDDLYDNPLVENRANRSFFMKQAILGQNCSELSNGYWISINYNIPKLMEIIRSFCLHCGYSENQVVLYGVPRGKKEEAAIERKPFDLQEAVILLDVYLLERHRGRVQMRRGDRTGIREISKSPQTAQAANWRAIFLCNRLKSSRFSGIMINRIFCSASKPETEAG